MQYILSKYTNKHVSLHPGLLQKLCALLLLFCLFVFRQLTALAKLASLFESEAHESTFLTLQLWDYLILGIELRSLGTHGKHFIHLAIFSLPSLFCSGT